MIDEELEGAKTYAEKYVTFKSEGQTDWSARFKTMANEELVHSNTLHEYAMNQINKLNQVFTAPVEMQKAWDESHKKYVEQTAWIKQMLSM